MYLLPCITITPKPVVKINREALLNLIKRKRQIDNGDHVLVKALMAECGYSYSEELSYLENMKRFVLEAYGVLSREKADEALRYIRSNVPKGCWEMNVFNYANRDYSGYTLNNRKDRVIPVVPEYASIESIDVHSDGHYYVKYSNMTVEYYPNGNIRFTGNGITDAWICEHVVFLPVSGTRTGKKKSTTVKITVSNLTTVGIEEITFDPTPVTYW
jgi:hypothetical protein